MPLGHTAGRPDHGYGGPPRGDEAVAGSCQGSRLVNGRTRDRSVVVVLWYAAILNSVLF